MHYLSPRIPKRCLIVLVSALCISACHDKQVAVEQKQVLIINSTDDTLKELHKSFDTPPFRYRPETWFHLNGKNISEQGLSADLEAIKYAGMQGIQLFNKSGPAYPGVPQISILSPEWEQMIGHVADETERLGLHLTLQNCPGWSMAGGPWVPVEESQREVIHHSYQLAADEKADIALNIATEYLSSERNYQDIKVIAFPTPRDEGQRALTPIKYQSNNPFVPWDTIIDPSKRRVYNDRIKQNEEPYKTYQAQNISTINGQDTWLTVTFAKPETLRTIELPPIRTVITNRLIPKVDINILVEAISQTGKATKIANLEVPSSHWYDRDYPVSLSVPDTTASRFRLTFSKDPLFLSYLNLNGQVRLHNHEAKASKSSRSLQSNIEQAVANENIIDSEQVIDISEYLSKDGTLQWRPTQGNWTVVRLGHVNMLKTNRPAEPEATGWETSKVDKIAIENHLRNGMMGNLMRPEGPLDGHALHGMLIDSWESHVPTWTMQSDGLLKEFERRRGYDMRPYLPAKLGYVVNSVEQSNRFLRDLRQTMDDLYVEHFFAHFRTVANDMGAKVYTEGASGEVLPGDPMRYYGVSDFPMTEFWYPKAPSNKQEAKPIFAAASAVHLYDKPFLAAEAATQLNTQWNEGPATIQNLINENFAKGVSHLVFHTFSHTPQLDVVPGSSFGGSIGFPLLRTQTWWRHTPSWIDALSRSQLMLQQGEFVADVLWYLGDELDRHPFDTHPFPEGYKFDYLNEEILLNKVTASNYAIHVKGAGDYRVIMLRDSQNMLLSTAKKLQDLVTNGAVVLGNKPLNSPSLMDDNAELSELKTISDNLWENSPSGMKSVGKGRVYWGQSLTSVLAQENIQKDVSYAQTIELKWLHRRAQNADIYFIANPSNHAVDAAVSFRQTIGSPEVWQPATGLRLPAKVWHRQNNITHVGLSLGPHESMFVVFNHTSQQSGIRDIWFKNRRILSSEPNWYRLPSADDSFIQLGNNGWHVSDTGAYKFSADNSDTELTLDVVEQTVEQNWRVKFESVGNKYWDTPEILPLNKLTLLNEFDDPAIQHYSGSLIYTADFNLSDANESSNVMLDLGEVYNIVELWLNDKKIGTRWAAPYQFDITNFVVNDKNELKLIVTNTWRNQLIFDNQRSAAEKKTWTTNPPKQDDNILDKSGLAGPVRLRVTNIQ
ncbi:glycosyl hydrolase [Glaciecola sp. SC05]|uniref:glycosyl hydrolase n=1 Tax=Glaciecola sp. SC05 TaxID=1987355 RepID=UPI003528D7FF